MSFFDEEESPPKKKMTQAQYRQKNKDNKQTKCLNDLEKSPLFPTLMIRSYGQTKEEFQQILQDYVVQIYKSFQQKKHGKIIQSFQKENDEGNIQYKLKLVNPTVDRLEHLETQMRFRVREGTGQAFYRIGVQDNGKPLGLCFYQMHQSLKTICYLANRTHTDVTVLRVSQGIKGLIVELMIRQVHKQGIKLQIRMLLFGESGSGKSTLLGSLISGQKDDGKGHCRLKVFTHKHEFMSGTTTKQSHHAIGFDSNGKLVNQQKMTSMQKWLENVNKIIYFIDVGGHKKAQKQLISSLCSFFPQYALWIVSGKQNLNQLQSFDTDNLQLAKKFNLPLIVVMTHLDKMVKDEQIEAVFNLKKFLKKLYPDKTPCVVKEMQYAVLFSRITSTEDVIPIFIISNVTSKNIDLLTNFMNLLTSVSQIKNNEEMHTQFLIADKYVVDKNIILAGTVIKGSIKKGQILHLGPDTKGGFRAVQVSSIECLRVPVKFAKCGQICTAAIKLNNYAKQWLQKEPNAIRRGMVLIQSKSNPKSAHQFSAQFYPYHSNKEQLKIKLKYQPVINTLNVRQICSIVSVNEIKKKQKSMQVPGNLSKKKSRSIDNLQKYKSTSVKKQKKLSKNSSMINAHSKLEQKPQKSFYKKSLDLTNEQLDQIQENSNLRLSTKQVKIQQKKIEGLQTIEQEIKTKKKKEVQEVVIKNNQPLTLRLRFKYMPEYISAGQILVINELKLIGKIKEIFY